MKGGSIKMRQYGSKLLVKVLVSVFAAVVSAYVAPAKEINWIDAVASLTYRGTQSLFEGLGSMPRG